MIDKKNTIEIQTLTPIHVGSGVFLQFGTDFYTYKDGDDYMIGVVDDRKVLEAIGENHLNEWVNSIERGKDICELIKIYAPSLKPESYAKRMMVNFYSKSLNRSNTLKECIHDGLGRPYIPGSSIKGAIRTCVLAEIMGKMNLPHIQDIKELKDTEKKCFGSDPNSDVFRFLQVGDATFVKNCEVATMLVNINLTQSRDLKDSSKKQLVEAIDQEMNSTLSLKLCSNYNSYSVSHDSSNSIKSLPNEMSSVGSLFATINTHTKKLLLDEIDIWSEIEKEKNGAVDYINNIGEILEVVESCKSNECVLRLGHASGWRFMTGAWTEALPNFDKIIPPSSRPKNYNYEDYMFPKTRRLDDENYILGFIKMKIL